MHDLVTHATSPTPGSWTSLLHALPKVELHCHLLGTVRRATFEALVRQAQAPVDAATVERFFTPSPNPAGAIVVLRLMEQHLLRRPDDLHRLMYEYLSDAARHNVRHAEVSWNPSGTAHISGMRYHQALPALVQAMVDAQRDLGIHALLIPAIDREAGPRAANEMVQWVVDTPHERVVGIGMDYREAEFPPELFVQAYDLARRHGLKTTAHAGEFGLPPRNVGVALDQLKVDRIDHGYTVVQHPELLARCVEQGTVFTVVPSNSYYRRTLLVERWAAEHPIGAMLRAGLAIHPNTDDPTLHHVTPTDTWVMMVERFGATASDLTRMLEHGLRGAWIDDAQRRQWQIQWLHEWQSCMSTHGLASAWPASIA
jgi:adenine deaminase